MANGDDADGGDVLVARPRWQRLRSSSEAFAEVFRHRDLRYLELALGLNWTAENAYLVALSVYAYEHGGATAVGLAGLVRMIPAGVAGLFGAVVADRYRRAWLLRILYLGRALLAGATALAFFAGAPVPVIFALAALLNVLAVLLRPAYWALLPDLARAPEHLVACNVVASIFEGLAWLVGPAVAAVLIGFADPGLAFAATALVLLASAIYSARVRTAHLVQHVPVERNVLAETLAGVRTVTRDRNARLIFGLFGVQSMVRGALSVLIVVAAIDVLDMGEPGVGWLNSAFGVGGLVGAVAAMALVGRRRLAVPFGIGLILWGAPIALVGLWPNAILALILLGIPGLGNAVADVAGLTMLQRIIPNRVLGRVFGALEAQVFATVGLGSLLAAGLISWVGMRGALIITGVLLPALVLLSWRRLHVMDDETVVPEAELALLRGVPMFGALPSVALEHLAASLERVTIPARGRVFREGEAGDRLYVIVDGEVRVSTGRTTTAKLGPGDFFGEIALIRGVPRTATVTARGDLELFALRSEPFLQAVSGNCLCADEADKVIVERLEVTRTRRPTRTEKRKVQAAKRTVRAAKRTAVPAKRAPAPAKRGRAGKRPAKRQRVRS